MKKIVSLLTLLIATTFVKAKDDAPCLKANVLVVVDWSGSMQSKELDVLYEIQSLVLELPVNERQVWLGIMTFTATCKIEIPISPDQFSAAQVVLNLGSRQPLGQSELHSCLSSAGQYFALADEQRGEKVANIIVIISDSELDYPDSSLAHANSLKYAGYNVRILCICENIRPQRCAWLQKIATSDKDCWHSDHAHHVISAIKSISSCL